MIIKILVWACFTILVVLFLLIIALFLWADLQ